MNKEEITKELKEIALNYHIPVFLPKSPIIPIGFEFNSVPESRTMPMFTDYLKILAKNTTENKKDN